MDHVGEFDTPRRQFHRIMPVLVLRLTALIHDNWWCSNRDRGLQRPFFLGDHLRITSFFYHFLDRRLRLSCQQLLLIDLPDLVDFLFTVLVRLGFDLLFVEPIAEIEADGSSYANPTQQNPYRPGVNPASDFSCFFEVLSYFFRQCPNCHDNSSPIESILS